MTDREQKRTTADSFLMVAVMTLGMYIGHEVYHFFADEPKPGHRAPVAVREEPRKAEKLVPEIVDETPPPYRTIKAKVTAYCPGKCCCGPNAIGKTSTGDDAYVFDGVAVDPRAIPYRSKIEIPGIGMKEADDTGGAMRRYWEKEKKVQIDVRMPTHEAAKNWGVKELEVRVYPTDLKK